MAFLGTNDFSYTYEGGEFGDYDLGLSHEIDYDALIRKNEDGSYTYAEPTTSTEAYAIMLHKMQQRYPDAEIYCMSLMTRRYPVYSKEDVGQPTEFNAKLKEVIDTLGVNYIELEGLFSSDPSDFDLYMGDKRVHPNKDGMNLITEAVVSAILGKNAEICDVTNTLTGVSNTNSAAAALIGGCYTAELSTESGYSDIAVTVIMNGVDVTSDCYANGKITISNVTGDIVITAVVKRAPLDFRWDFINGELVSTGAAQNPLTQKAGTITDGVFSNVYYSLTEKIVLCHDLPWVVEFKAAGSWSGMLFSATQSAGTTGNTFFFKTNTNTGFMGFGERTGSQYNNYGIALGTLGVDTTSEHTYRLENRIAPDGTNMVCLLVDGVDYGPMNNYFIGGSSNQNTTVDWLNGRDFTFSYIGANNHALNHCTIDYIQVWESGRNTHSYTATVTPPTCTEQGYTTYTCACGDSYRDNYTEARHQYQSGICGVCGAKADPYLQQLPKDILGCSNLYDLLTPTNGYYTATKYDTSNGAVLSVVIPVEPGDRISASSFGPKSQNMGSVDGIRVTYLFDGVIVLSLSAGDVYNAYMRDGYITVPEGVNMVCIPWWKPDGGNTLLLSQISKDYAIHSPASVPEQAPTCTEKGYTAGEICEICHISLSARTEIPAAGHNYSGDICTVCGMLDLKAILNGKYVSILGDSISTFAGYSNDIAVNTTIGGNAPRYQAGVADTKPGSYCLLESVNDTWWMQFANQTGMNLLVNNSWAGSQVFGGQTSDGRVIPAAYLERCLNLHDNTLENNPNLAPINPDIIFVYLGINDYNFNRGNVGSGEIDYAKLIREDGTYVTPTTFGEAYAIMLHKMQQAYPHAQIFAMTLLPENLYSVDLAAWEQHNAYIRAAAEYYGIPVVDLAANCAITWDNYSGYMIDKIHPTTEGMKLISDCIGAELSDYYQETKVNVQKYIQLNGTAMWLVTANRNGAVDKISGKTYTYNGQKMYWSSKYRAYCYLVVAETLSVEDAKAAIGDTLVDGAALNIEYNMDVNNSGKVDANDAQLVYNMYQAKAYGGFDTVEMIKFLEADLNDSVGVDSTDVQVIISSLLNNSN